MPTSWFLAEMQLFARLAQEWVPPSLQSKVDLAAHAMIRESPLKQLVRHRDRVCVAERASAMGERYAKAVAKEAGTLLAFRVPGKPKVPQE